MSTSCLIAKQVGENDYLTIYCHSDGYLTHTGALLVDFYDTEEKVNQLMELGDLSVLKEKLYPNPLQIHNFVDRQECVSVAYGRDRGEKNAEARMLTIDDFNAPKSFIDYMYIFDSSHQWKYFFIPKPFQGFEDVKEGLEKEYARFEMERPKGYYGDLYEEMAVVLKERMRPIEGNEMEMPK